jgi:hypothetical protein
VAAVRLAGGPSVAVSASLAIACLSSVVFSGGRSVECREWQLSGWLVEPSVAVSASFVFFWIFASVMNASRDVVFGRFSKRTVVRLIMILIAMFLGSLVFIFAFVFVHCCKLLDRFNHEEIMFETSKLEVVDFQ